MEREMIKYLYKLSLLTIVSVIYFSQATFGSDYREGYTFEFKITPDYRPTSPESFINTPRVQLFSITPATDFNTGHQEFERIRNQCRNSNVDISTYTGLLLSENGSRYLRGQLAGFSSKEDADYFVSLLKRTINTGPYAIPSGIVSQPGFTLQEGRFHYWS